MPVLYFATWDSAAEVALGQPTEEDSINISATATESNPLAGTGKKRKRVRIFADSDCFVTWGENPTASSSNGRPMGAENPEYFDIQSGHKISVIERA